MVRLLQIAFVAVITVLLCDQNALADQIEIKDEAYAQLPADAQEALVAKLKEQEVISKDDTVKYVGPTDSGKKESLSPALLLTLAPAACKIVAAAKKEDDLGKCATRKEVAAQDQCKQEVESKFGTIETICNAIKLF